MSDERKVEIIYQVKVCRKMCKGRPRLTFESTVLKILEEGHVKSSRTPREICMKTLMSMNEAKEVYRDGSVWRSVLSDYPAGDKV